jgi:hypothetical protein
MSRLPPIIVSAPRPRIAQIRRGLGATLPTSISSGGASTPVVPGSASSQAPVALPPVSTPGAPPNTATAAAALQQAQTDWQNQVVAVIATGDSYLNAGETAQALSSYQAAGNAGATSVGPEIDLIGYPQVSQPWTQKAWRLNALLAATTSVGDAQAYVKNLSQDYQIALSAVLDKINGSNIAPLPSIGPTQVVMAAGLAAVIGGVLTLWKPW